jgi:coatomer subunit beta'
MGYEIIKEICEGLNYMKKERYIIHLDLKPENILMDATMVPKIADFGLSRIFHDKQ